MVFVLAGDISKRPERLNVVNVEGAILLLLTAMLAGVLITLASRLLLSSPVRAVVFDAAPAPQVVVLARGMFRQICTVACFIAELVCVVRELTRWTLQHGIAVSTMDGAFSFCPVRIMLASMVYRKVHAFALSIAECPFARFELGWSALDLCAAGRTRDGDLIPMRAIFTPSGVLGLIRDFASNVAEMVLASFDNRRWAANYCVAVRARSDDGHPTLLSLVLPVGRGQAQ
jgi:hypothetical protein